MKASSDPAPVDLEDECASSEAALDMSPPASVVFPPEADIGTHLVPVSRWTNLTRDVLDRLTVPVMVLNARAGIEYSNEAARRLVARADGGALLEAVDPADTAALHALVRAAARGLAGVAEHRVTTARTHLQGVFEKTGARRQSQLTRLLEAAPALMLADDEDASPGTEPQRRRSRPTT